MNPAPFSSENSPSTCVYSAQGNLVCQKSRTSDPIIPMEYQSCGKKQIEKYMDFDLGNVKNKMSKMMNNVMQKEPFENKQNSLPPYDNLSTAMNMNYSVSPWPF